VLKVLVITNQLCMLHCAELEKSNQIAMSLEENMRQAEQERHELEEARLRAEEARRIAEEAAHLEKEERDRKVRTLHMIQCSFRHVYLEHSCEKTASVFSGLMGRTLYLTLG